MLKLAPSLALLGLAACAGHHTTVLENAPAAPVPAAAVPFSLAESNAAFAVDLLRTVGAEDANEDVFLSPYSISTTLAMAYAGARNGTADEMRKALHLGVADDQLAQAFAQNNATLAKRAPLHVASAVWGESSLPWQPAYTNDLAANFGAPLQQVDFQSDSAAALSTINHWVDAQTQHAIPSIFTPRDINRSTALVLANAMYLNANWQTPFNNDAARDFHTLAGGTTKTTFMLQSGTLPYASDDTYQAVALPYEETNLAMVAILPAEGTFTQFEAGLDGTKLLAILDQLADTNIDLTFLHVNLVGSYDLTGPLRKLGIASAFDPGAADFTGMMPEGPLFISKVAHQTLVQVTDKGTIAAAATGSIGSSAGGPPARPPTVVLDRPFLMAIVDRPTKTLLFLGHIVNPAPVYATVLPPPPCNNTSSGMGDLCDQ